MPDLTTYKGGRFTEAAAASLRELDRLTPDIPVVIVQGGWNGGTGAVKASAGTHDGDAVDIRTRQLTTAQKAGLVRTLRMLGWAAWYRQPNWDRRGGGEHIHAVPNGWGAPSAGARRQADQYRRGTNGLASRGPDDQLGATGAYRTRTWPDYLTSRRPILPASPAPTTTATPTVQEDDMPSPADLWSHPLDNPATPQKGDTSPASLMLQQAYRQSTLAVIQTRELRGMLAGLTTAIGQLAAGQGVDLAAVTAAAEKGARAGVAEAVDSIDVVVKGADR